MRVSDLTSFQQRTSATASQCRDLEIYRELLTQWRSRMNLVSASTLPVFWSRHAFDSWQLLDAAPEARRWADLGSGAGLPGIVLAIFLKSVLGAEVHLVESASKRCIFLRHCVTELELPASVHQCRAETFSLAVDVVTARACAPLTRLLSFAEPWLSRAAVGLFLKGETVDREIAEARDKWAFSILQTPSLSDPSGRVIRIEGLSRRDR